MKQIEGFSIPFRIDTHSGSVVSQRDSHEKIKENIIHILLTGIGERVMRRDYGGGIRELVHDPNNDVLQAMVSHRIAKSIGQWEQRVQLQEVNVRRQNATLFVDIDYIVTGSAETQVLSVPINI